MLTGRIKNEHALTEEQRAEWDLCVKEPDHFIRGYVQIYDATASKWIPFDLWPAQEEVLRELLEHPLLCILKARQQGFTWLLLAYALWLMLFHPAATILLFSKGDKEAIELLDFRMKGIYGLLPEWMHYQVGVVAGKPDSDGSKAEKDSMHEWLLKNGSRAISFATTGGRSYTGTFALVDEADFIPKLGNLLNAVEPTIDAGGKMALLSTPDKSQPESPFKRVYQAAKQGLNKYKAVFYGWRARPGRTDEWYEARKRDVLSRTGALDDLQQEYPATDIEALSPRSLDKRIPPEWLQQCLKELPPRMGRIVDLDVFIEPVPGREYVIGADPAEGNPNSDDSSLTVLDRLTGEEVACMANKIEPKIFASVLDMVGQYYNNAELLVERNNHGHAVIGWLQDHSNLSLLEAPTDSKPGWQTNSASKAGLYVQAADDFRLAATTIHSRDTYFQLASIEGATLKAPDGQHDDRAVSYVLGLMARTLRKEPPPLAQGVAVGSVQPNWKYIR